MSPFHLHEGRMQGALASGYVGQTVRIALGKSTLVSRVAYIDSPASRHSEAAARTLHPGSQQHNPSYWPGAAYTRLRPELVPTRGPLSRPHYLRAQHSASQVAKPEEPQSSLDSQTEGTETQASAEHESSPSRDAHTGQRAEYYTHERGQLLDLGEHKTYHDARLKNASFVCQAPAIGSMPTVRRSVIEASGSVIAQDHDLKIVSCSPRMVVGQPESGFLKPQLRATQNRISRASTSFLKDTCVGQRRERGYINLNEALDEHMDDTYARERFSVFDVFSNQKSMKQVDGEDSFLTPPLTLQDVDHFESAIEGTKEAIETRWSRFFESASIQTTSPIRGPTFKIWDSSRRLFFHRLSLNLQFGRKEEIWSVTESLKPLLSERRKANPFNRSKVQNGGSKSKGGAHFRDNQIKIEDAPKNEDWPSVFENPFSSLLPQHINELCKTELPRSLIIGLILFASSTTTHPLAPAIANVLSNLLLSPLGYNNNPVGAHLLLTHLGVPLCDPLDLPYIFNLAEEEGSFLRPYPFLPNSDILESFVKPVGESEDASTPSLETVSPRHFEVKSFSPLHASSCDAASQVLRDSIQQAELNLTEEAKTYLSSLADAGANPDFRFSRNLPLQTITVDATQDSSQLLKFADLDADGRKDVSALPSFAIDDSSTTEVDDAFALDMDELLPYAKQLLQDELQGPSLNGTMDESSYNGPKTARILIHIADPTTVMRVGDDLEMTARERVETVYLPHRKSFMLPSVLSEYYCSLQAHPHKNIALTFEAHVDLRTGELVKHDVFPSKFNSMKRLTYDHVQSVIRPGPAAAKPANAKFLELIGKPLLPGQKDASSSASSSAPQAKLTEKEELALRLLAKVSRLRKQWRVKVGKAESMHLLKSDIKVDATTSQPKITLKYDGGNASSQSLVEEMMVMVGEITGRTARDGDFAVPYRRQENRTSLILEPFDHTLYTPHPDTDPLLYECPDLAPKPSYETILNCEMARMKLVSDLGHLNYMNQSSTSSIPLPHRSLGLSHYSRASSPLRRYADIIGHLQLKAWKRYGGDKSKLPYSPSLVHALSQHINFVSKDIKWSQQNSERWWKQQYVLRNCMERFPSNEFKAIVYATPNMDMTSGYVQVSSGKALLYSFFILGLDILVQLPTPVHLNLGQIVSVKPTALSELHLEWTVVPQSEQTSL